MINTTKVRQRRATAAGAAAKGPNRTRIPYSDLPAAMKKFVEGAPKPERPSLSLTLRALVSSCRKHGLPEVLSTTSAERLIADAVADGWKPASLGPLKSNLRSFARATGQGTEWAVESLNFDQRPLAEVLAAKHWIRLAGAAHAASAAGLPSPHLRIVDRWLRHRARLSGSLSDADVRAFTTKGGTLQVLSHALGLIDPGNPDNRVIEEARRVARRRLKPRIPTPKWNGLPEHLRHQLDLVAALPAGRRPADASIDGMCAALRRLVRAAEGRGLPQILDRDTAAAFAEDLLDGSVKASSGKAYVDLLERFARLAGYPAELVDEIRATIAVFRALSAGEVRRKEIALAERPVELVEVAASAHDVLEQAPGMSNARDRCCCYNLAGAMALLVKLPLRSKDLRLGRVGHEFRRDSEGWQVDLVTSKTGTRIRGRLAAELARYLDAALLHDTDPAHLWRIYDERQGKPLFANAARGWQALSENWLWANMRRQVGHGPHIVRTLMYDECILDEELDAHVAGALCGHRTTTSGKAYEVRADGYRKAAALKSLDTVNGQIDRATEPA